MDFNNKNFQYVTKEFGPFLEQVEAGGMLYLRALSTDKPTESPASLGDDYPEISSDFVLPASLDFVTHNLFSSVLRISGPVNMWLHYDVSPTTPSHAPRNLLTLWSFRSWPTCTARSEARSG